MKFLYPLAVLPLVLWLAACSPIPFVKINWQQQQPELKKIQQWTIRGRIAVQNADDGGQADYVWKQINSTDYDIRLQAPLGAGTIWLSGRLDGASLKTSTGEQLFDTDVDRLMLRLNGWSLPVSGLYYWVRGLAATDSPYKIKKWNENGSPAVLLQNGWRIEFKKQKIVKGFFLPGKLFISREDNEEVEVRLIIRQWTLGNNNV